MIAARELARRAHVRALILGRCFPQQRAFISDRARLKAALCSRRAGKTEGVAYSLLLKAATQPGSLSLYLGLTKGTARTLMWERLKLLLGDFELAESVGLTPNSFNETRMWLTLRNGAVIRCSGADANKKEMEKLLGDAYDLVVIDEAASFTVDLKRMVRDMIWPAMMDRGGAVMLTGTPGDIRAYFYDVTRDGADEDLNGRPWSVHRWRTSDNPHMARQYAEELATIEAKNPLYVTTPEFRCMYLGEWAVNESRLVYAYNPALNVAEAPPKRLTMRVISVDLGVNDACAMTSAGWAAHDRKLYLLRVVKAPGMSIEDVAKQVRAEIQADPSPYKLVIDGAWKQSVMELRTRYQLPFVATEKTEKAQHIRMFNTDLQCGRTLLVAGQCEPLIDEMRRLLWSDGPGPRKEDPILPNDACDSALYAWRFARAFSEQDEREAAPQRDAPEAGDHWWKQAMERAQREAEEALD